MPGLKKDTVGEKIAKAFDSWSANSALVNLNEKQASTFIDYVVDESIVLKQARVVKMTTPKEKIAAVDITSDIFFPGVHDTAPSSRVQATTSYITLNAQEIVGAVDIFDSELMNNIEGASFKEHLMRMIAKKAATQLDKVGLYSKLISTNPLTVDRMFTGWITDVEANGNVVDASDSTIFGDRYIDKDKLSKAFKSIPTGFQALSDGIYMPWNLMIDYETKYEASMNQVSKNSAFGITFSKANELGRGRYVPKIWWASTSITSNVTAGATTIPVGSITWFTAGKPIVIAYGLGQEHSTTVASSTWSTITLSTALPYDINSGVAAQASVKEAITDALDVFITPKFNNIYGIQLDMTIEPQRFALQRKTTFVFVMFIDTKIQNPDLAVVIKWVKEK